MTNKLKKLTEPEFQYQFENKSLHPDYFDHKGHLRIAWIYLNQYNLDTALEKVCSGIQSYAQSLGSTDKFHLTITDSIVRIMAKRINNMQEKNWNMFLTDNTDLVEDAIKLLGQYYTKEVLFSDVARTTLLQPDLKTI